MIFVRQMGGDVMGLFLPFLVIILFSLAIALLIKVSTVESIFISIVIIIITTMIFTIIVSVSIGVYFVLALCAMSLIIGVIKAIKEKVLFSRIKKFFFNPAFAALFLAVAIYTYIAHNTVLFAWDDFSHWGLSVKALIKYDSYANIPLFLRESQTTGIPIFNTFITKLAGTDKGILLAGHWFAGEKEGYWLVGSWLVYWVCLLLPVSRLEWKDSGKIFLYSLFAYSVLMFFSQSKSYADLYCDTMLSVIAGALVLYYHNVDRKKKQYIFVMCAALLLLPHIKRITGVVFAYFLIMSTFGVTDYKEILLLKLKKKKILMYLGLLALPLASFFLYNSTYGLANAVKGNIILNYFVHFVGPMKFSPVILAFAIAVVGMILAGVMLCRRKKIKITRKQAAIAFWSALVLGLGAVLVLNLNLERMIMFERITVKFAKMNFYTYNCYKFVGFSCIVFLSMIYLFLDQKYKKIYIILASSLVLQSIIYFILVSLRYVTLASEPTIHSLERYLASFIFYIILIFGGVSLLKLQIYKNENSKKAFIFIIAIIVFSFMSPVIFKTFSYQRNYDFFGTTQSEQYISRMSAEFLAENTSEDDAIYVVAQGEEGRRKNIIRYCLLGQDVGGSALRYDVETCLVDWRNELVKGDYEYVFISLIDEFFVERYGKLFDDVKSIGEDRLYRIEVDKDENVILYEARVQTK